MSYKFAICVVNILLLFSCTKRHPQMDVNCIKNKVGNYIIRWETMPVFKGPVEIYSSTSPECSASMTKVAEVNATDQIATIVNDNPDKRYYFTLIFEKKYHIHTATRKVMVAYLNSLIDFGGYYSAKYRSFTKWGQLYHSLPIKLDKPSVCKALSDLGIKTIINLRSQPDVLTNGYKNKFNMYHVPLEGEVDSILLNQFAKCCEDSITNNQRKEYFKALCNDLLNNHLSTYRHIFDLLCNEKLYPILLEYSDNNTLSDFMATLILFSLNINNDTIIDDFNDISSDSNYLKNSLQSSDIVNIKKIIRGKELFIKTILSNIQDYYGGVDDFINDALKINKKEKQNIKDMMFYNH